MTNARIERLTREALGHAPRETYTRVDDLVLRAVGIVILMLTIVIFAAWPREDADGEAQAAAARATASLQVPVSHRGDGNAGAARKAEYSPLY